MRGGIAIQVGLVLLLGGCSLVPAELGDVPDTEDVPDVRTAGAEPDEVRGETVFWGGTVESVHNAADATLVEVVARPLNDAGAPREQAPSDGRFLARFEGFVDPADYSEDKRLAVVGRRDGVERRHIGDYEYPYPVVRVERHYRWPPAPEPGLRAYPHWHDPWYDPWWPRRYYRDPFHYHRYH